LAWRPVPPERYSRYRLMPMVVSPQRTITYTIESE
jgi:hypothetical protein